MGTSHSRRSHSSRLAPCRRLAAVFLFLCVMPAPTPAFAQEASIVSVVTDESGGILPGVSVAARSPSLQVPQVLAVMEKSPASAPVKPMLEKLTEPVPPAVRVKD